MNTHPEHPAGRGHPSYVDELHWLEVTDQNKQLRAEVARLRRELAHVESERDHARHDLARARRENAAKRWWQR